MWKRGVVDELQLGLATRPLTNSGQGEMEDWRARIMHEGGEAKERIDRQMVSQRLQRNTDAFLVENFRILEEGAWLMDANPTVDEDARSFLVTAEPEQGRYRMRKGKPIRAVLKMANLCEDRAEVRTFERRQQNSLILLGKPASIQDNQRMGFLDLEEKGGPRCR